MGRNLLMQNPVETPVPYQVPGTDISIRPEEIESPRDRLIRLQQESKAKSAGQFDIQQMLGSIRSENAEKTEALKRELALLTDSRMRELIAMRIGASQRDDGGDAGFENLMQSVAQGTLDLGKVGKDSYNKIIRESQARGILPQTEKFKDESKKLGSTAQFVQLAQKAMKANPRTPE
jgi:hypothetical protein